MPEINSPLGSKTFKVQATSPVFTVPDESEFNPQKLNYGQEQSFMEPQRTVPEVNTQQARQITVEEFNAYQAQKQAFLNSQKKISSDAKERINILLGLGRKYVDVKIGERTFTLRTLKDSEQELAFTKSVGVGLYELRINTLSMALDKIDGLDVKQVLGIKSQEEIAIILHEFTEIVINHLYNKYADLLNSVKKDLNIEEEIKK